MWWQALIHGIGADYGAPYGHWVPESFWSGFGSDLGEVTILAALATWLRHANCEVHGCWRLGRHQSANHRVCRVHHPDDHLTAQDVLDAHRAAQRTERKP